MELSIKKNHNYTVKETGNPCFTFFLNIRDMKCTCLKKFPCTHFNHLFQTFQVSPYTVDILHMKTFRNIALQEDIKTWNKSCLDFINEHECCICMEPLSIKNHVSIAICRNCTCATHKKCRVDWNGTCPTCGEQK